MAFLLPDEWPARSVSPSYLGVFLIPFALILMFVGTNISNLKVIHADITFKMAEPFTKNGQWEVANFLYKESLRMPPRRIITICSLGEVIWNRLKLPIQQPTRINWF